MQLHHHGIDTHTKRREKSSLAEYFNNNEENTDVELCISNIFPKYVVIIHIGHILKVEH